MHDLQLMASVHGLLERVEALTGKGIGFWGQDDLPVQAELHLAGEEAPAHRLVYRRVHDERINYLIANRCGHLIRLFTAPVAERYLSVANGRTMMSFLLEIEGDLPRLGALYGRERLKSMLVLWYEGVVFQLTRMPPDGMIDRWLYDAYPELRPLQKRYLYEQQQAAVRVLSPEVRQMTPPRIYFASNVMNYAFLKTLEDHLHLDLVAPYHSTIFLFDGAALARKTKLDYTDSHRGDRAMIDAWAEQLGLTGWFEWIPFAERPRA